MLTEPVLSLAVIDRGGAPMVRVSGDLDISSAPQLTGLVDELLDTQAPPLLRIDLAPLTFFSAAGVTALLRIRGALRARRGRLILCDPPAIARQILAITGVIDRFEIEHTGGWGSADRAGGPTTGVGSARPAAARPLVR